MNKILVTGATGFIGLHLLKKLVAAGYEIKVVTRNKTSAREKISYPVEYIECDLNSQALAASEFRDVSCVIHLAGESIDGRWTENKKKAIIKSRVESSANVLKNLPMNVTKVITVSAQGIYQPNEASLIDEDSPQGNDFLADVCKQWEEPFLNLQKSTPTQIAILRLGLVVSAKGGALAKMLPIFQKNLGAAIGSGRQWISWIHIDDVCEIILNALKNKAYAGPINLVTSNPVTNADWTNVLCSQLNVFQLPRVPEFVIKTMFGEMSSILLTSRRIIPKRLQELNYKFLYPTLEKAFAHELKS